MRSGLRRSLAVAHLAQAVGLVWWWVIMPHGFAPSCGRFWLNELAPLPLAGVSAITTVCAATGRGSAFVGAAAGACAAAWCAFGVASLVLLPDTGAPQGIATVAFAVALGSAAWTVIRAFARPLLALAPAISVGAGIGCGALLVLRAPPPSTRPHSAALPPVGPREGVPSAPRGAPLVSLGASSVEPRRGRVYAHVGPVTLEVAPVLSFDSRAPDGGWTPFASAPDRAGPSRTLASSAFAESRVELSYRDDGRSTLVVVDRGHAGALDLEIQATSELPRPIYSHLNTFAELSVRGHRRLSLAFSPCPDRAVDVLPSDYPTGRPLRSAHLLADGRFVVVEATTGEKGPFRTLATGPLARAAPLTISVLDDGKPIADVQLLDWAAQASTEPSPTAGWGIPQNAIEFSLDGDAPGTSASIFVTLASTSVGRGFDTVGHAAGTYRNTIRLSERGASR